MSNIGFIYKISNTVDNDIYVGSTQQTIQQRFKRHLYNTKMDN